MNLKKDLQQQAYKDAESLLTENDKQFCAKLAEEMQDNTSKTVSKKFKLKTFASVLTSCAAAIALLVTLPFFTNKTGSTVVEVRYKEENIVQESCSIADVNSNSKYFELREQGNVSFRSISYYDSVSSDKLYYSIEVKTDISEITLNIVVNKNYKLNFELRDDLKRIQLTQYEMYFINEISSGLMETDIRYTGYITINTEIVYIDYAQLFDLGEQAFFDDIQNVLKVKGG